MMRTWTHYVKQTLQERLYLAWCQCLVDYIINHFRSLLPTLFPLLCLFRYKQHRAFRSGHYHNAAQIQRSSLSVSVNNNCGCVGPKYSQMDRYLQKYASSMMLDEQKCANFFGNNSTFVCQKIIVAAHFKCLDKRKLIVMFEGLYATPY